MVERNTGATELLATADKSDDFDSIAVLQRAFFVLFSRNQLEIAFDRAVAIVDVQFGQQVFNRRVWFCRP